MRPDGELNPGSSAMDTCNVPGLLFSWSLATSGCEPEGKLPSNMAVMFLWESRMANSVCPVDPSSSVVCRTSRSSCTLDLELRLSKGKIMLTLILNGSET